jgi:hypothetical protein
MSVRTCRHRGTKLPDSDTCGGLCDEFPECLPEPSRDLVANITRFRVDDEAERKEQEAITDTLNTLRTAILDGKQQGMAGADEGRQ